jgi:ABC-type branched-subunit amino acid transport system substrate-binding protein
MPGRRAALTLAVVGVALTTMGVSRCGGSGNTTVTVNGNTLTIYASAAPPAAGPQAIDVLRAEQLALSQSSSKVAGFTIRFIQLHRKPSDNARKAIQDKSAIAYLGELEPGITAQSMGITNDQDLLQVSPTDTALELTQSTPAVPGAPNDYYEARGTYGRTFARVVPSSAAEAKAQVSIMRSLHVKKLYVADDGSPYGRAIAHAVRQDAAQGTITVVKGPPTASGLRSSGADALFLGASAEAAGTAAKLFAAAGAHVKLFAPSALASAVLPAGAYVSQPGFMPTESLATAKQQFVKPFEARYGHAPATQAIFGYEAMSAVLAVLRDAGTQARDRTVVVHDFQALRDRSSVIGTYSIKNGNPTVSPFVFSRVQHGALIPWRGVR